MLIDEVERFPASVRAADLILTSSSYGRVSEGGGAQASTQAYHRLLEILDEHGLPASSMVRLDHFTQSQGWLAERQKARAAAFGMPARLASTGIATPQEADCLLSVSGIAVASGEIRLVASGSDHDMPAIAAAVRGGPFLFISGILSSGQGSASAQIEHCLAKIEQLLALEGLTPEALMKVDVFAEDEEAVSFATTAIRTRWMSGRFVFGGGGGLFEHAGQIEINALALIEGSPAPIAQSERWVAGGGLAVSATWNLAKGLPATAIGGALAELLRRELESLGLPQNALARLELRMPPAMVRTPEVLRQLGRRLDEECRPAVVTWIAEGPPAARAILDLSGQT